MRPFEMLMMAALGVSLGCSALAPRTGHPISVGLVACLLAAAFLWVHLYREGAHWQLGPAYAAFLPTAMLLWLSQTDRLLWPWELSGFLLLVLSCGLAYAIPMFHLPAPTGAFAVGTRILHMIDTSRLEDAGAGSGGKRELMVQLWYPAEAPSGMGRRRKLACYRRKEETSFLSSYQAVLRTHSFLDAPILRKGNGELFPVLIFNPSWRGRRTQNTFLTEELASHGYVVAAIDHTYNSMPVAFPDGRVAVAETIYGFESLHGTDLKEIKRIGNKEADKQALDVRFVLDELGRMNDEEGGCLFRKMDTTKAGAFGHSFGGGVSVQAWATDARIQAAMNMDGWSFGSQVERGARAMEGELPRQPLLFIYRGEYLATTPSSALESGMDAWDYEHVCILLQRYGGVWMRLKGANHPTFTDKVITSPIRRLSGAAEIDARRAHAVVRACAVAFFNQALKGRPAAWLQGESGGGYGELMMGKPESAQAMGA
jgi:dienelactone hydrolase